MKTGLNKINISYFGSHKCFSIHYDLKGNFFKVNFNSIYIALNLKEN